MWLKSLTLVLFGHLLWTLSTTCATSTQDIAPNIYQEVELLKTTSKVTSELKSYLHQLFSIKPKKYADKAFCETCKKVVDSILEFRRKGANKIAMIDFMQKLCSTFSDWGDVACAGYINIEMDTGLYIIDNNKNLTAERVCATAFQKHKCQDPNRNQWHIEVPGSNSIYSEPKLKNNSDLKVLHLTDLHYDPLYEPGSNAKCDVPLCCQKENGAPSDPKNAAGFWGDYNVCDMPWHSITDLMDHLKSDQNFDLVYYTGDIISHKSWATTKDHNVNSIKAIYKLFEDTFKKIPVYPILGNHEPHPTDFYSPGAVVDPKVSTKWLFELIAEEWSRWLPEPTKETIRAGGYYTVLVRPGFRIVALNSNVCFISNLWLLYNDNDPYDQLKWLVQILTQAENAGERVHILSHIPPGHAECLENWAFQFRRIVNRFSSIISAQFNGHTHLDELRVFYDIDNPERVINVAFNGGSFTTFVGFNPNIRTYEMDGNSLKVLDYHQYIYNLTEANQDKTKRPEWFKLYSFKEAYGLSSTSNKEYHSLIKRIKSDKSLVEKYYRYSGRESEVFLADGCNDECLAEALCSITAVDTKQFIQCYNQYV